MNVPDDDSGRFMRAALRLAVESAASGGGGPFAAVVVRDGEIVGRGSNGVTGQNDPTAHAEVQAIRDACRNLGTFRLEGCEIYCSSEPCPMCLGAIYWARLERVYYANDRDVAAEAGFDDAFIYEEIARPIGQRMLPTRHLTVEGADEAFRVWEGLEGRIEY